MKTIEDQFIPNLLESKLIKLGFDRNNRIRFIANGDKKKYKIYFESEYQRDDDININWVGGILWQQAFEFLEDKYKLYSTIDNVVLSYGIVDCRGEVRIVKPMSYDDTFKTREEVKYACLNELINLIK